VKTGTSDKNHQQKFNFSPPQPRPFLANLPGRIDTYEEGIAQFFHWRTGMDYYLAIDQIVDFVVNTRRVRVVDLLTDTATLALRLAGRKAFPGRIYSFDTNVTLLERAKQRAAHLNLQQCVEFRHFQEPNFPLQDGYGDLAVSMFDLHRHPVEQYLAEVLRILSPDGYLIAADILEPKLAQISPGRLWRKFHLQYIKKNPIEAHAVYYDREEIIKALFKVGFRQVIIQGLNMPAKPWLGVFSLIAATK
jgi:ubiquinone/menaquinone biosynthesis C-methylase UbiE